MFPEVREAIARLIDPADLRWISWSQRLRRPAAPWPVEGLIDYAAGELSEAEAAAIEEHLFSCAGCGARAADVDALAPGAVVPCAVWDGDQMMVLRLRGDFGNASEFTVSRRVAGAEADVKRVTGQVSAGPNREILFATPAAGIRDLPEVELQIVLTAQEGGAERPIGTYTLLHAGSLRR